MLTPLLDEPLTRDEVCTAARAAVEDYGEDYRDPNGGPGKACLYLYEDNPRENGEPRRCLIGEIVWRARGVQIPANENGVFFLFEYGRLPAGDTADMLIDMQNAQDDGEPWGEIVAVSCDDAQEAATEAATPDA